MIKMKGYILVIFLVIFLVLFCGFTASAQNQCQTIEDCQSKLSEASRIINKLLDVNKEAADVITAKNAEIEARKNLNAINEAIIAKQESRFNDSEKEVALLKKKAQRKVSILFGLIKITY